MEAVGAGHIDVCRCVVDRDPTTRIDDCQYDDRHGLTEELGMGNQTTPVDLEVTHPADRSTGAHREDPTAARGTGIACCPGQVTDRAMTSTEAADLSALLKALADPVRLQLVSLVASDEAGEVCACDLPDLVDRSQSTVSHHLSLLVAAGILQREQRGRWAWFRCNDDVLAQVAAALVPAPNDPR
jgi:ArsR family transcriptional regulator